VRCAGGWLFDQVMAGWDVTVVTADHSDQRALEILGVRGRDLETVLAAPVAGPCLQAIAVYADLYDSDERVRRMVQSAAEDGKAEVRLWGDTSPADDCGADCVSHRLSLAARAFKAQAVQAVHTVQAEQTVQPTAETADTEVFMRGEIRRPGLVSARYADGRKKRPAQGSRELEVFRCSPKRALLVRLLRSLGPPPPPPRRHFSNNWCYGDQYGPGAGRNGREGRDAAFGRGAFRD
jgi:hypothetical protein